MGDTAEQLSPEWSRQAQRGLRCLVIAGFLYPFLTTPPTALIPGEIPEHLIGKDPHPTLDDPTPDILLASPVVLLLLNGAWWVTAHGRHAGPRLREWRTLALMGFLLSAAAILSKTWLTNLWGWAVVGRILSATQVWGWVYGVFYLLTYLPARLRLPSTSFLFIQTCVVKYLLVVTSIIVVAEPANIGDLVEGTSLQFLIEPPFRSLTVKAMLGWLILLIYTLVLFSQYRQHIKKLDTPAEPQTASPHSTAR